MSTCGSCFHYRLGGKCKNQKAATYGESYDSDSTGCQLHATKFLLPFSLGIDIVLVLLYIPLQIISALSGGGR